MTAARFPAAAAGAAAVPSLVLGSQSPRRFQLLTMLGLTFETLPAELDESYLPGEEPAAHVHRLAREKALAVAGMRPDALVVGSDTVVVLDGEVLGKPADADHAVRMLMRLQGRDHWVQTGIAVAAPGGGLESGVEGVRVHFRAFDEPTAWAYVATGEPMDKAGAYGIQGWGATIVDRIEGDFFAVMGLPIARMIDLFRALGWEYNFRGFTPRSL